MYVFTAVVSFLCFAAFGALISIDDECLVVNPEGRCCGCVAVTEAQLDGQTVPKFASYNDLFNGLATITNAGFGIVYVFYALKYENRYLLFCMVVTQFTEVVRCLLDVILDPKTRAEESRFRAARYLLVVVGAISMLASWFLVRPVYKLFGWRIFRRGGAKRSVRDMYKMFQRFRAMNLLDIQAAVVLFFVYVAYLDVARTDIWVFVLLSLCEVMASRFLIKYLKREDFFGVVLTIICKLVAMAWWIAVGVMYYKCYARFQRSIESTTSWWYLNRVPDLGSVLESYRGRECLASHTMHDDRTLELVTQTLIEAVIFRIVSTVFAISVSRNFHRGLRDLFYVKRRPADVADVSDQHMLNEEYNASSGPQDGEQYAGEYSDDESQRYAEAQGHGGLYEAHNYTVQPIGFEDE